MSASARWNSFPEGLRRNHRHRGTRPKISSRRPTLRPFSREPSQETRSLRDVRIWSAFHTWTAFAHLLDFHTIVLTVSEQTNSAIDLLNPVEIPRFGLRGTRKLSISTPEFPSQPCAPSTLRTVRRSDLKPIDQKNRWLDQERSLKPSLTGVPLALYGLPLD